MLQLTGHLWQTDVPATCLLKRSTSNKRSVCSGPCFMGLLGDMRWWSFDSPDQGKHWSRTQKILNSGFANFVKSFLCFETLALNCPLLNNWWEKNNLPGTKPLPNTYHERILFFIVIFKSEKKVEVASSAATASMGSFTHNFSVVGWPPQTPGIIVGVVPFFEIVN